MTRALVFVADLYLPRRSGVASPDRIFRPLAPEETIDRGKEYFGCLNVWKMTDAFQLKEARVRHRGGPFTCCFYRQRIKLTLDDERRYDDFTKRCGPIPFTKRREGKLVHVLLVPKRFR